MVGYPLTSKEEATCVNLVASILPTLTSVDLSAAPTWWYIGSNFLQWPHHGA